MATLLCLVPTAQRRLEVTTYIGPDGRYNFATVRNATWQRRTHKRPAVSRPRDMLENQFFINFVIRKNNDYFNFDTCVSKDKKYLKINFIGLHLLK